MKRIIGVLLGCTLTVSLVTGCGESVEAIHKAADSATGNQAVRESKILKQNVEEITAGHEERIRSATGR